jgi:hypothetical protein
MAARWQCDQKASHEGRGTFPVLAVMATAGLYDDSGKWLTPGLPPKGRGGGIIAVSGQVRRRGHFFRSTRRGNSVRARRPQTRSAAAPRGKASLPPLAPWRERGCLMRLP